jgi:hypothetical protein
MAIVRNWAASGQQHAELIFTSGASLPRTHTTIGRCVKLLAAFLCDHPQISGSR